MVESTGFKAIRGAKKVALVKIHPVGQTALLGTAVGQGDQVGSVLLQRVVFLFGGVVGDLLVASDRFERFENVPFLDG